MMAECVDGRSKAAQGLNACDMLLREFDVPFQIRAARGHLDGRVFVRYKSDCRVVAFRSDGHVISRQRSAPKSNNGRGDLIVSLQLEGGARVQQDGCQVRVDQGSGAIGLLRSSRPFELVFPDSAQRIMLLIPHSAIRQSAPWLVEGEPLSLPASSPMAGILREYLLRIGTSTSPTHERENEILIDGMLGVLSLATAPCEVTSVGSAITQRILHRNVVLAYLRRNLGDPEISPHHAALYLGLSVRSIHKLFEGSGTSFGTWLRNARLDAALLRLRSATADTHISAVAYEIGFGDLSHFNHCFKQRFGVTPREWRRSHCSGLSTSP